MKNIDKKTLKAWILLEELIIKTAKGRLKYLRQRLAELEKKHE